MNEIPSKCQNCGSELKFDPKSGALICKYCGSNYFLPKKQEDAVIVRQYSGEFHPNGLNQSLRAYKCNTCGNTYYMSSDGTSKKCPNCANNTMTLIEDPGYVADGIIPFSITKEEAAKNFARFLKGKTNYPKELKKSAENQKLMGVFVPIWNFSLNVIAEYSANVNEVKKGWDGNYYSSSKPIFGDKVKRIKSLDACATTQEDDELLELFDENDYAKIIPFIPEYTYGYKVDATNKDIHEHYYKIVEGAEQELKTSIKKELLDKYKEISGINTAAQARDVFFNYTYVPVFVNTFTYRNKTYKTYISGTTGKVIGKTPKSTWAYVKELIKIFGVAAGIALIVFLLSRNK
ncbi:MAG: TFIIB-type zinc ribbon-containing protein [Clostridia bacterium]|nr:TFIIB-type zinc ribbon-containing protein [Clostridia bacterium]